MKKLLIISTGRDLNELVTVCDKEGNLYKAENYGLKFKFEPVPYLLVQEKEEPTNQANFVDIDENGVLHHVQMMVLQLIIRMLLVANQ